MPLPPYIRRSPDEAESPEDRERYQTVVRPVPGAVAAPTAGLHFTRRALADLEAAGIETAALTLLVGAGTFTPVRVTDLAEHRMHSERVVIPPETAAAINRARRGGRKITAVGTTVVRSLEHAGRYGGEMEPFDGRADLFIRPGVNSRWSIG